MAADAPGDDGIGVRCDACHGEGEVRMRVTGVRDGRGFCEWRLMTCYQCRGAGRLTAQQEARRAAGQRRRDDRVRRGVSLREEAMHLGISPKALSDKEWGRDGG